MWVYEWTRLGETNNSKREFKMRSVWVYSMCVCTVYGEEETYVMLNVVCSMNEIPIQELFCCWCRVEWATHL